MIVATDTDDVDGSNDDDDDDEDNDSNTYDYDGGFNGGKNNTGFSGLISRLIYSGKTLLNSNSIIERYG